MKCHDCKKRIWGFWQTWCSAMLDNETKMYDYHKKCFRRNHYNEWKFFHPEEIVKVFSGEKIPQTGYYRMIEHNKNCDKVLQAEHSMFMVKGSEAHRPIACQHDVKWELIVPYD